MKTSNLTLIALLLYAKFPVTGYASSGSQRYEIQFADTNLIGETALDLEKQYNAPMEKKIKVDPDLFAGAMKQAKGLIYQIKNSYELTPRS